jgi:predicted DNA-binding transcriptional regulator YafY
MSASPINLREYPCENLNRFDRLSCADDFRYAVVNVARSLVDVERDLNNETDKNIKMDMNTKTMVRALSRLNQKDDVACVAKAVHAIFLKQLANLRLRLRDDKAKERVISNWKVVFENAIQSIDPAKAEYFRRFTLGDGNDVCSPEELEDKDFCACAMS